MISRLKGRIIEKQPPHLLIDVQGVGYEVQAPMTSFYPLPAVGEEVIVHTHLSVSENAHQLFAFYTQDERRLFRTLIKVSGVGPKMALAILSGMPVDEFVQCVMAGDPLALVKVPGVGKKTAERLIVEVKDRLRDWAVEGADMAGASVVSDTSLPSSIVSDAQGALVALGYKSEQAAKVIALVRKESATVSAPQNSEALIRLALQRLAG